jgi:hypothetical protein
MLMSILGKEFLKLRVFWVAALVLNICVLVYLYISMNKLFRMDHPEVVWYYALHLGEMFFINFKYVPLFTGVFFAAAQFLPEMRNQRFRISLHLPIKSHMVVFGHLFVGGAAVVSIYLLDLIGFYFMASQSYPSEYVHRVLLTILPWCMGGLASYLGTTLIMLEPTWRVRGINFVISTGLTALFFMPADAGAYVHMIPALCIIIALFAITLLIPAHRFRYRRV